jgi:hypothetical protein
MRVEEALRDTPPRIHGRPLGSAIRFISDEEASELDNRSSGFEGAAWFLAVVVALISAIQYWTG